MTAEMSFHCNEESASVTKHLLLLLLLLVSFFFVQRGLRF